MKKNQEIALRKLAKSWNNLNIQYIESILSDDFTYKSQWSSLPVIGRQAYLTYLDKKFQALKDCSDGGLYSVTAEIAIYKNTKDSPCILLSQKAYDEMRQVVILIRVNKAKICRLDIVSIASLLEIELTGEIPK